jgi:hypothetical protein
VSLPALFGSLCSLRLQLTSNSKRQCSCLSLDGKDWARGRVMTTELTGKTKNGPFSVPHEAMKKKTTENQKKKEPFFSLFASHRHPLNDSSAPFEIDPLSRI